MNASAGSTTTGKSSSTLDIGDTSADGAASIGLGLSHNQSLGGNQSVTSAASLRLYTPRSNNGELSNQSKVSEGKVGRTYTNHSLNHSKLPPPLKLPLIPSSAKSMMSHVAHADGIVKADSFQRGAYVARTYGVM